MDAAAVVVDGVAAAFGVRDEPAPIDFSLFGRVSDVASVLLEFLGMRDAGKLRQLCKLGKQLVKDYPWNDDSVDIVSLRLWRNCFDHARKAKLAGSSKRAYLDADFTCAAWRR